MELDIDNIAEHYSRMPDQELIHVATQNARGIRPEVFGIIENEIKKRNLNPDLLNAVIAQNKEYSFEEISEHSELLRDLPCPICGSTNDKLNGTVSHTVKSFLVFTTYEAEPHVACPNCLTKKNNSAILSTALLGWWGIPWGLLKTPVYIYRNLKAKQEIWSESSNNALLNFTLFKIGEIEAYKDNKEKLRSIIKPK